MAQYLTVKEIAELLGKHEQTIYRKINSWGEDELAEWVDASSKPYRVSTNAFPELENITSRGDDYTEFEEVSSSKQGGKVTSLTEYLEREIQELKEGNKELSEKIVKLTSERDVLTAMYAKLESEHKQLSQGGKVRNLSDEQRSPEPIESEEKEHSLYEEEGKKSTPKVESKGMSDTTFYLVIAGILIIGAVGLYITEFALSSRA